MPRIYPSIVSAIIVCTPLAAAAQEFGFSTKKGQPVETLSEAAAKAVHPRLISEEAALAPGRSGVLALTLDIAPGWHLYWHNPGDSGLPITWKIEAPDTLTFGEAQWPAPERSISAGEILDYTYSDRVTILLPVELSQSQPLGSEIKLRAKVSWLVCREGCVPGDGTVELTIPVASTSARGPDAERIDEARARLPKSSEAFRVAGGSATWVGQTLTLSVPGARSLEFYPYASENAQPLGLITDGAAQGSTLAIAYRLSEGDSEPVRGVVEVNREGRDWYYFVEVSPPAR